jgi:hypothetical protein
LFILVKIAVKAMKNNKDFGDGNAGVKVELISED